MYIMYKDMYAVIVTMYIPLSCLHTICLGVSDYIHELLFTLIFFHPPTKELGGDCIPVCGSSGPCPSSDCHPLWNLCLQSCLPYHVSSHVTSCELP